ncbi:hypothetical protein H2200_012055 [Cladophialophora chaetospira]|uniref:Zn(2)-C6 fungal-type domain-containing protein n=1 Tax=Cladophialophora chaetospira TaxID=386627 RepID=A0AA39CCI5_9EURO|nr:hypothetical protein H2200_012055 [Cladophialophora chaetospira]
MATVRETTKARKIHVDKFKVRSKLGCGTYRTKRIKCDQEWPVCLKCIAACRVCDGYGVWGGGGNPYGPNGYKSKMMQSRFPTRSAVYSIPNHAWNEDRMTFEMLKRKMGIKLSGIFDSDFWDMLVLQASFDEPAILHAVAAIGSAYRSDRLARDEYDAKTLHGHMDQEGTRALLEYNRAIRSLKAHLIHTDLCSLRVTLITCMLFICFEYLRRNLRTGDTHLLNGLRLVRDIQARRYPNGECMLVKGNPPDSVDDHLIEAFARLNLQCALFGLGSRHTYVPPRESLFSFKTPTYFESVQQARRQLDGILGGTYHLLLQRCNSQRSDGDKLNLEAFVHDQQQLESGLASWLQTYHQTLAETQHGFTDTLAFMVLRMYHTMASIITSVCHPLGSESDFDLHTADFVSLVKQAIELAEGAKVHMSHRPSPWSAKKSFTVDMGYIPVLYYLALKCRNPRIRRHAINMMCASPHREGVWDGELSAAIARRVVEIEEADFYKGWKLDEDFNAWEMPRKEEWEAFPVLPEAHRIHQVNVILPQEGVANSTLQCIRRRWVDSGWQVESRNHSIPATSRG